MNLKAFFVAALSTGLETRVATCEDLLRHATPDVLAQHLPRPLWARLIQACLGAPKVDATLVVETVGIPNLCEHVPAEIIWACIAELGARSLGGVASVAIPAAPPIVTASPAAPSKPLATPPPPAETPKATPAQPTPVLGPSIPVPELVEVEGNEERPIATATSPSGGPPRARPPVQNRFRQSSTGIGRLAPTNQAAAATRKPQVASGAAAPPPPPASAAPTEQNPRVRRGNTEPEYDLETDVGKDDWKNALAVEDEQLVDWTASDETQTSADELGRKR